ncbi:MAG: AMP-binding protein [Candidatus Accumulibacter sp.]|uniref:AMP-binding protein n=1 Tax=Accumulibacter sp. TaxID=2053492 RepID=UPI002585A4FA|nr:AMP-binding protein [Accumulibacter sp.]MCM8621361.1 AMP-binding protein [Accumulibacter sp.]
MTDFHLFPDLISRSAARQPKAIALSYGKQSMNYGLLWQSIANFVGGVVGLGLQRGERIAIYLENRLETVIASFGATAAGCVFVPLSPLLKADQVGYILRDCNMRALITSPERLPLLASVLPTCHDLRHVIQVNPDPLSASGGPLTWLHWDDLLQAGAQSGHRVIDTDMAAILYTSGSTGKPKGFVLSHRNMVAGAKSVASHLENTADDTLLAALPLSFDAGFSQLTTGFHAGARVVLLNQLPIAARCPQGAGARAGDGSHGGATAVHPALATGMSSRHLRISALFRQPRRANATRNPGLALRERLPKSRPYLMDGLTEAFRSTYLPPDEVDRRPDSIGKAIPNAEILLLRENGSPCAANEPGELVHRGALVGMSYWNDHEKTAERYKPLPASTPGRDAGLVLPEIAVFSGDTVRKDEEGFLYFIGRRDEMMKTSGYRVSPTEVEEVLYATQLVGECVAFGVDHPTLGQAMQVIVTPHRVAVSASPSCSPNAEAGCLPTWCRLASSSGKAPLPRNPNGKIDRKALSGEFLACSQEAGTQSGSPS